jgi:hypothetical protein
MTSQPWPSQLSTGLAHDRPRFGHGVMTMNDLLIARMGGQFGAFTTADAYACGHDSLSLRRLLTRGAIVRVGPRAYVDGRLHQQSTPAQRHALATRAIVRSFEGRAAASHYSALALMKLPIFGASLSTTHVVRESGQQSRRRGSLAVHRTYGPGALCTIGQTLSVVPALAVIGSAMTCGIQAGVVAADAALARAKTTPEELAHWIEQLSRRPRLAWARQAVQLADARSESPGESRTRVILAGLGYIDAEPQARVTEAGRILARVDLMVCGVLVVEFDGAVKYEGAQGREALVAEKKREDLLRQLGYGIVRLVWSDLADPLRVQSKMLAEIALLRQRRLW